MDWRIRKKEVDYIEESEVLRVGIIFLGS